MKGYSPMRRWLREERAREHGMLGAGSMFMVDATPREWHTALVVGALGGPSNMRTDSIYGEGIGMLLARAGLVP